MAGNKWIRLKSGRERVHRVSARMLRSRLEAIARYLPLAAQMSAENVEYVHQLRVWARRADAALDLCKPLISKANRRELEEQLDVLRDAAGGARDADVLRDRIAALKAGVGREHLVRDIERRRRDAQAPILQANDKLGSGKEFLKLLATIIKRLERKRHEKPFRNRFKIWSVEQIRPLAKKFIKRGQADLTDLAQLHKFRIAGKRLRYAMEIVWDALDKRRRKRVYEQLDRLQMQLGSINDLRNLTDEIERALAATGKRTLQTQLRRLLTTERRRLTTAQQVWAVSWSNKKAQRLEQALDRLA